MTSYPRQNFESEREISHANHDKALTPLTTWERVDLRVSQHSAVGLLVTIRSNALNMSLLANGIRVSRGKPMAIIASQFRAARNEQKFRNKWIEASVFVDMMRTTLSLGPSLKLCPKKLKAALSRASGFEKIDTIVQNQSGMFRKCYKHKNKPLVAYYVCNEGEFPNCNPRNPQELLHVMVSTDAKKVARKT